MHDIRTFDRLATLYDFVMPSTDVSSLRDALDYASGPVEVVVDLGGGPGRAVRALTVDGLVIDPARGMLERASHHGLAAVRGTAEALPLRSNAVDAVLIVDALHHFPDAGSAIREAADAVRPGGVVVIRDFDPDTLRGRALVVLERVLGFDSQFLSVTELRTALDDAGLDSHVVDSGFAVTVVAVKPKPSNEDGPIEAGR